MKSHAWPANFGGQTKTGSRPVTDQMRSDDRSAVSGQMRSGGRFEVTGQTTEKKYVVTLNFWNISAPNSSI